MNEWMNEKLLFILKSKIALSINPTGYYFLIKIFSLYNFKKLKIKHVQIKDEFTEAISIID